MSADRRSNKPTVATDNKAEKKKAIQKNELTVFPFQSPLNPNHAAYMAGLADKAAKKKKATQKKG